jgi:hypothetical protein
VRLTVDQIAAPLFQNPARIFLILLNPPPAGQRKTGRGERSSSFLRRLNEGRFGWLRGRGVTAVTFCRRCVTSRPIPAAGADFVEKPDAALRLIENLLQ